MSSGCEPDPQGALIRLSSVSLRFRKYGETHPTLKKAFIDAIFCRKRPATSRFVLFSDFDLKVGRGERLGVIGSNGAGKSTLLKLICGVYRPSAGVIHIRGRIAPLIELGAGFNPEMSGLENIYLNGAVLGFSPVEMEAKVDRILDFSGLKEFALTPVKYYSTGMVLRLAFSIATDVEPEILLVDEIFAAGDAEFVERAKNRMRELIDLSHIVVLVSHDLGLIQQICNRAIWIHHGKIVRDGAPAAVCEAYLRGDFTPVAAAG